MKNQEINSLLQKYSQGTIADSELAALQQATHLERVVASAVSESAVLRRARLRRMSALSVALLLVGGGVALLRPQQGAVQTMPIAQVSAESVIVPADTAMLPIEQHAVQSAKHYVDQTPSVADSARPKAPARKVETIIPMEEMPVTGVVDVSEMKVLCNIECDADSVLSEVFKFLQV